MWEESLAANWSVWSLTGQWHAGHSCPRPPLPADDARGRPVPLNTSNSLPTFRHRYVRLICSGVTLSYLATATLAGLISSPVFQLYLCTIVYSGVLIVQCPLSTFSVLQAMDMPRSALSSSNQSSPIGFEKIWSNNFDATGLCQSMWPSPSSSNSSSCSPSPTSSIFEQPTLPHYGHVIRRSGDDLERFRLACNGSNQSIAGIPVAHNGGGLKPIGQPTARYDKGERGNDSWLDSADIDSLVLSVLKEMGFVERKLTGRGWVYYQLFGLDCTGQVECHKLAPYMHPHGRPNKTPSTNPASTLTYVKRSQNNRSSKMECVFCKNLPNHNDSYKTHWLKDSQNKVTCPVLRAYNCPLCNNKGGDAAHTVRYCPLKRQRCELDFQRAVQHQHQPLRPQPPQSRQTKWTDNDTARSRANNMMWDYRGTIVGY